MFRVIPRIPFYYLYRLMGRPSTLPLNLTLSITFRCNSRCNTCNIYKKDSHELSLVEWKQVFKSLGGSPFWVTISGGEPFLRPDIVEIVCSLYDQCRPAMINIPTNGILYELIPNAVRKIALYCKKVRIVINLSMDEIGEKHDEIRGVQGNFEKALKSLHALKSLDLPNLSIGIHTVVSRFNVTRIPTIYRHLHALDPDSYITEIAEERVELGTMGSGIAPDLEDYFAAVDFLTKALKRDRFGKMGQITRAFRLEYYRLVRKILKERRQVLPCYAGFASCQIAPDGHVWMCCMKAESIGSLRKVDYDFGAVWHSEKAATERRKIKAGKCYCPLANAGYTNMLLHAKSLFRVGRNFFMGNPLHKRRPRFVPETHKGRR